MLHSIFYLYEVNGIKKIDLPFKKTEFFLHIFKIKKKKDKKYTLYCKRELLEFLRFFNNFFLVIFRIECLSKFGGVFS